MTKKGQVFGRPCSVCGHPSKKEIEALLRVGRSKRYIADAAGLSIAAVYRHWHHMGPTPAGAGGEREASGRTVSDRVLAIVAGRGVDLDALAGPFAECRDSILKLADHRGRARFAIEALVELVRAYQSKG